MPAVANETGWRNYPDVRLATLALYVGLFIGGKLIRSHVCVPS